MSVRAFFNSLINADNFGETSDEVARIAKFEVPSKNCRHGLVEILRLANVACEVTVTARQYSLRIAFDGSAIRVFEVRQDPSSTLWMHFLPVRVIFDAESYKGVEDIAKAEINAAINMFSLFPGTCRIEATPLLPYSHVVSGLDLGFLDHANCTMSLQDVHPFAANRTVRIDYSANAHRDDNTASVISLAQHRRTCNRDANAILVNARDSADTVHAHLKAPVDDRPAVYATSCTDEPLLLLRPTIPHRPVYQHRQRLHLS